MNNICVYRHIKQCGEVFYVGIGNEKRPYTKRDRNDIWLKTIKKYPNYNVEILYNNLDLKTAKELEIFLIDIYGRKCNNSGTLCNISAGGEGAFGVKHSYESRKKMSDSHKGITTWNKNKKLSKTHKNNLKLKSGMAKKVICTKTNKIWNSVVDCAFENNLKSITLSQYLRGMRKNKTTFKFLNYGN